MKVLLKAKKYEELDPIPGLSNSKFFPYYSLQCHIIKWLISTEDLFCTLKYPKVVHHKIPEIDALLLSFYK